MCVYVYGYVCLGHIHTYIHMHNLHIYMGTYDAQGGEAEEEDEEGEEPGEPAAGAPDVLQLRLLMLFCFVVVVC